MKPRSISQIFVLVLCTLAIFLAQAVGSKAAYVCVCGGQMTPTSAAHCEGPHGQSCHDVEAQTASSEASDDLHGTDGCDRKEHEVVVKDLRSAPSPGAVKVFAPQVLLAVLPVVEILFAPRVESGFAARDFLDLDVSPPPGVSVARTVVLLI